VIAPIVSMMSNSSKSPWKVTLTAFEVARDVLPDQSSRYSNKIFTQPQLLACQVFKRFMKTDYCGIAVTVVRGKAGVCPVTHLGLAAHF